MGIFNELNTTEAAAAQQPSPGVMRVCVYNAERTGATATARQHNALYHSA